MPSGLELNEYRTAVHLDELPKVKNDEDWSELLMPVLEELGVFIPQDVTIEKSLRILHGALAPIDPYKLSNDVVHKIETIAAGSNNLRQTVNPLTLQKIAEQYKGSYPVSDQTSVVY